MSLQAGKILNRAVSKNFLIAAAKIQAGHNTAADIKTSSQLSCSAPEPMYYTLNKIDLCQPIL